jgi:hypothetical protein
MVGVGEVTEEAGEVTEAGADTEGVMVVGEEAGGITVEMDITCRR